MAVERRRPRCAANRGQTGSAAAFAEGFTIPKAGRWGCPHARARRRQGRRPAPPRFPGHRGTRATRQGSRLAGGDIAAAPAFYLLDVAGAAESEGPADDVIVVKSQQTQQLTKDLVKTIAAHGFSALRKRRARVHGRRGSIADRRAPNDAQCDRPDPLIAAKVAQVTIAGHPWTVRCF